ncbi:MAG: hypothetical protein GY929_01325 [Actinomycetia bacterium]|nr:hypothetical protein [Actinomycetes bacterium]
MNAIGSELWDVVHKPELVADELSVAARRALGSWISQCSSDTDDLDLSEALRILRWAVHSGAIDYLPPEVRDSRLQRASAEFGVSRSDLVQLLITSADLDNLPESARPRPLFIAVEGVDSSGKTTQVSLLGESLERSGYSVKTVAFPRYEEFFGRELRSLLDGDDNDRAADTLDPRSMALWYASDRADFFRSADLESDFVILNRYSLSSAVYQSARALSQGGEDLFDWVMELEHVHFGLPEPHLTIVLDIPSSVSISRSDRRGRVDDDRAGAPDVYERSAALQERAALLYRDTPTRVKGASVVSCVSDDGKPLEAARISAAIEELVMSWRR